MTHNTYRLMAACFFLLLYVIDSLALFDGTGLHPDKPALIKVNATENTSSKSISPGNSSSVNITGGPDKSSGLPGDTLDMPYTERLMIALAILTVAMILSLFVCYRKECNVMYWRYKKKSSRVKYEPLKVKMQVPPDV